MSEQNVFPPGADVLIASPLGKQWKLHSWQLNNYAPVLGALIKGVKGRHLGPQQKKDGITLKYLINMIPYPGYEDGRFQDFECVVSTILSSYNDLSISRCYYHHMS